VAAGEPGAEERLKELEDRLKESEESGFRAYIPMSLEDLKTNRNKQGGALGGVASFMIICICLILLVVIASKGGRRGVKR
jgi:Flp pilus assembly protein TadB